MVWWVSMITLQKYDCNIHIKCLKTVTVIEIKNYSDQKEL